MDTSRLEAFSDGVMAVIITIMVLGLKVPEGASFNDLKQLLPNFLIYALSFLMVGIYWNNHHQLLRANKKITSGIMWSNLLLLFCLSLIPFFTNWFGQNHSASVATAAYGTVLLAAAISYWTLLRFILKSDEQGTIRKAVGNDFKGNLSLISYIIAIPIAFISPWLSVILFIFVALIWFIPDKRLDSIIS